MGVKLGFGVKKRTMIRGAKENIWTEKEIDDSNELCNLCPSPNIIRTIKLRRMRWARHVARMGEKRNAYRILMGQPEGKRPLGRPRQ
jgi:hypothetical protein